MKHKALQILPSERLAKKRMHKQVDALANSNLPPWADTEHRRQHDALMRRKRIALAGRGACIIAAMILYIALGVMAARCFDEPQTKTLTKTETR